MTSVLQVVTDTDRRGAQIVATELDRRLQARGYDVRTVALTVGGPGASLALPVLGGDRLAWSTLRELRRAADGVDVVVAHGSTTLPASVMALSGRRVPIVYRSIGDPGYWASSRVKRARMRLLLIRPDVVVPLWNGAAEQLRSFGVLEERIAVIPQWVDTETFIPPGSDERDPMRATFGAPDGVPVVGVVGALSAEKDIGLAIEAAAVAGAFLVVVGEGPMRGTLERHAASRLSGRHRFLGSTQRPSDALAGVDALALTSRTEGMPAVALEAAAMRIPVVATAVGSLPELFDEGIVAELVETPDPDLVANALVRTWNRPDMERSVRSRDAVIARHSIDGLVPRWEAVLGHAMGDRTALSGTEQERTS